MKKETTIDRVLIVFNPDGSMKAAHFERLERVLDDDGSVLVERSLPAEALDQDTLKAVIGSAQSQLLAQNAAALNELATLRSKAVTDAEELALTKERNAALIESNAQLLARVEFMDQTVAMQKETVAVLTETNAQLAAQNAEHVVNAGELLKQVADARAALTEAQAAT